MNPETITLTQRANLFIAGKAMDLRRRRRLVNGHCP